MCVWHSSGAPLNSMHQDINQISLTSRQANLFDGSTLAQYTGREKHLFIVLQNRFKKVTITDFFVAEIRGIFLCTLVSIV